MQIFNRQRAALTLCALVVAAAPLGAQAQMAPGPAASGAAIPASEVPCDKAAAMMLQPMPQASGSAAGDVDKAYATMMMAHAGMMMTMAKMEMRCGKDKKLKDNAARTSPDLQKLVQTLTIF